MIISSVVAAILIIFNIVLQKGLKKILNNPTSSEENNVICSVITAARNEEKNIEWLFRSLEQQDDRNFEHIIVDDYSDDQTLKTSTVLKEEKGNILVIRNESSPGKKPALASGIAFSSNEFILITDADCIAEKSWISEFKKKFSSGFDFLFGIAPFIQTGSLLNRISSFENLRSFILSISASGYNLPYSAAARSFAFKKSSFLKTGGYSNTMELPQGDDGLLLREAVRSKMKIGVVTEPGSFVYTKSKESWKEYLNQRGRHTSTSFYYSNKIKTLLAAWHLINFIPYLMLLYIPFNIFFAAPFIIKLLSDLMILKTNQRSLGYSFGIFQLIYLQFIYEFLLIVHFFNALRGKTEWK
jgi:glycosyltransferase involved in cell wall biosynthesis